MNQEIVGDDAESTALMLILDVRTWWSSTHQMLHAWFLFILRMSAWIENPGRALDYCNAIDSFVTWNWDLHQYELSEDDWTLITLVSNWLKSFRSATTQMSTTKVPMLSTTHAIFWGLQDEIKEILWNIPESVSPNIKQGLIDTHTKLSDYYYKYDESPFYTWAACK